MQPIGPFFLFLFLPVALLLTTLCKQHRALVTSLCSLLYIVLINLHAPFGILTMITVILLARLATVKPLVSRARPLALLLGAFMPLVILITTRTLLARAAFPYGLTVLTLLAIATTIDACRNGYVPPKNIVLFAGTLCFFPLLVIGPLVTGKSMTALFENQRMSLKNLFDGIRLYILGAIYIFIIAAPLYFIYQKIIATFGAKIDIFLLITCPLLATAFLLFFLIGMQKIARGLALMLGIKIACDSKNPYHAYDPAHFFSACHLSLAAYLQDYLIKPITAATRSNKVLGKLLSTIAASAFLVAILSPRVITWQIWLTSLPILCLLALLPYRKKAWSRTLTAFACTLIAIYVLGLSFTFPILSTPAPLLTWRSPADTLSLIVTSAFSENIYYLSASILCLSPLVVIVAFRRLIIRHIRHGMRIFHQLEMLILLFLFSIILFYFMPRFPALSTGLLAGLLL